MSLEQQLKAECFAAAEALRTVRERALYGPEVDAALSLYLSARIRLKEFFGSIEDFLAWEEELSVRDDESHIVRGYN